MKKIIGFYLVMVLSIFVLSCSESNYETLPEEKVNQEQKEIADTIATNILNSMKSGEYKALGEEATLSMQKGLSPDKQKAAYEQVKGMFGEFISMEYYETCVPKDGSLITVYRFKGNFESSATPEIRLTLNKDNKLSGFWIKPWNDTLQ